MNPNVVQLSSPHSTVTPVLPSSSLSSVGGPVVASSSSVSHLGHSTDTLNSNTSVPTSSTTIVTSSVHSVNNTGLNGISPPLVLVGNIPQAWDTEFFQWCIKNGVRCPKLSFPVYFGPQGIRGFLATEDINSYDDLLVVPSSLIISKTSCYCSAELGHVYSENYRLFEDDEDAAVATYICYHRAIQKENSFWWPYLRILPDIDVLADWSDQELLALQDSFLVDLALERRAEYAVISTTFTSLLSSKYPDIFPRDKFTTEWFTWAYKQVTARGFGSRLPEVLMVPLADCFNHGNVATKYTFEEHPSLQYRSIEGINTIQSLRINAVHPSITTGVTNSLTHSPTSSTSSRTPSMDPIILNNTVPDHHNETVASASSDTNNSSTNPNGTDPASVGTQETVKNNMTNSSTSIVDSGSVLSSIRGSSPVTDGTETATVATNPSTLVSTMEPNNTTIDNNLNSQRLPNNQHTFMMKQHVSLMKEGIFRMFPTRNTVYKANEPVYFSYGRRDNVHLAMEYGFTLLDNEHDMVVLYPGSSMDYGKLYIPPRARTIIDFAKISTGPFKLKWRSLDPNMLTLFRAISVGLDDTAYADFEAGRVVIFNRLMSGPMETAALQRLHAYLYSVLKGMGTSIEEDEMLLNSRDILPARLLTAVRYRLTRKHLIHSHILLTEERVLKLVKKSSSSSLKAVIAASNNVLASVNGMETHHSTNGNLPTNNNKVTPVRGNPGMMHSSPMHTMNNGHMDSSNHHSPYVNNNNIPISNNGPNMYNTMHPNNPPLPNNIPMVPNTNNNGNMIMRKGQSTLSSMAPVPLGGSPVLPATGNMMNTINNNNMGSRIYNDPSSLMVPNYPNSPNGNFNGNGGSNNNNSYPNMMVPSPSSNPSSFSMNNSSTNTMLPGMMNNNPSIPNNALFNPSGNLMIPNNNNNNLGMDMLTGVPPMPPPPLPQQLQSTNQGHQSIMMTNNGMGSSNFSNNNNNNNNNPNGVYTNMVNNMNQYTMNQYKNRQ